MERQFTPSGPERQWFHVCTKSGEVVDWDCKPTLSDGTAGNMGYDSITFELCQRLVDNFVLVTEKEIKMSCVR